MTWWTALRASVVNGLRGIWRRVTGLNRSAIRSLFAVAMLAGIMVLSIQGWVMIGVVIGIAEDGDFSRELFGALLFALKWTFYLIAGHALCVALVVFGADYLKFRYGDAEFGAGKQGGDGDA